MALKRVTFQPVDRSETYYGVSVPHSEGTLSVVQLNNGKWQVVIQALGVACRETKQHTTQSHALDYARRILERIPPEDFMGLGDNPHNMPPDLVKSVYRRIQSAH